MVWYEILAIAVVGWVTASFTFAYLLGRIVRASRGARAVTLRHPLA